MEWRLKKSDSGNHAHLSTAVPLPIAEAMERYGPIIAAHGRIDTSTPYSVAAHMITEAVLSYMKVWEPKIYEEFMKDDRYAGAHRTSHN